MSNLGHIKPVVDGNIVIWVCFVLCITLLSGTCRLWGKWAWQSWNTRKYPFPNLLPSLTNKQKFGIKQYNIDTLQWFLQQKFAVLHFQRKMCVYRSTAQCVCCSRTGTQSVSALMELILPEPSVMRRYSAALFVITSISFLPLVETNRMIFVAPL